MGNTLTVANATELRAAMASASAGDTILLKGGDYGMLSAWSGRASEAFIKYAGKVTLASEDPADPASFSGLNLSGAANITFRDVTFDYNSPAGAALSSSPFLVTGSAGIAFEDCTFDGDYAHGTGTVADGYGTGYALKISSSTGVTVSGSEIFNFHRGIVTGSSSNIVIRDNDLHSMSSDGLDFADVQGLLVEGNRIHDFLRDATSGAHPDMIQFWTYGTNTPSSDVIIRGNFLDSGAGVETQSIFMRNEVVDSQGGGLSMFYRNILIEDNVIRNAHSHGITVGETDGLTIRNNTLLHNAETASGAQVNEPKVNLKPASLNVTVTGNISHADILALGTGWTVGNNLTVQRTDPDGPNYYGLLFVNALSDSQGGLDDLRAVPGGLIEKLGVGAAATLFASGLGPSGLDGFLTSLSSDGFGTACHTFGARNVYDAAGKLLDLTGAQIVWDYGDGTTGTGLRASHVYAAAGRYDVTAIVTLADGRAVTLQRTVEAGSAKALVVDAAQGFADQSDLANTLVAQGSGVTIETAGGREGFRLNGDNLRYATDAAFHNNPEYTLLLSFRRDPGQPAGADRVIDFTSAFSLSLDATGVAVSLTAHENSQVLRASGLAINDGAWHDLALTYSAASGLAILYMDGIEVARLTGFQGLLQTGNTQNGFTIGGGTSATSDYPGLIGGVAFLNGALDAGGIAALAGGASLDSVLTSTLPGYRSLTGGTGDDVLFGDLAADSIAGAWGNDLLRGRFGADILSGAQGNDVLTGGTGNDSLFGGSGDDSIAGGAGADILSGGSGADSFLIETLAGAAGDTLLDLDFAEGDTLILDGLSAAASGGQQVVWAPGRTGTLIADATDLQDAMTALSATASVSGTRLILAADLDRDGSADWTLSLDRATYAGLFGLS